MAATRAQCGEYCAGTTTQWAARGRDQGPRPSPRPQSPLRLRAGSGGALRSARTRGPHLQARGVRAPNAQRPLPTLQQVGTRPALRPLRAPPLPLHRSPPWPPGPPFPLSFQAPTCPVHCPAQLPDPRESYPLAPFLAPHSAPPSPLESPAQLTHTERPWAGCPLTSTDAPLSDDRLLPPQHSSPSHTLTTWRHSLTIVPSAPPSEHSSSSLVFWHHRRL